MSSFTQDKRLGELKAPGSLSGLVLKRFSADEGISELFEFRIEAVSEDKADLNLGENIGKDVTVSLTNYQNEKRYFVGILAEASYLPNASTEGYQYVLVVRPWIYKMSKTVQSRVFKDMTIPDIVNSVAGQYGKSVNFNVTTLPAPEYVVQYNESDLDFVLRLLEQQGMSYHFQFSDGDHKMMVTDQSREDLPGGSDRMYSPLGKQTNKNKEYVTEWMSERRLTPNKTSTSDYDFENPAKNLVSETEGDAEGNFDNFAQYHWGYGQHLEAKAVADGPGKTYAKARLDMFRSQDKRRRATGEAVGLTPGYLMELTDHETESGKYLIVHCTHRYEAQDYRSGGGGSDVYTGSYEFLPSDQNFAPPMITPRPNIAGVQTGLVVSKAGSDAEIDVDKFGRILVHMHWNKAKPDENEGQTMRCRVLQSWAGTNWGTMFIPRKGMEVLVQHVDGDPDRPVVIGCVYNNDHMPPYDLPGQKNLTGWKSRSTESGGPSDYNEFVFDDTKGKELVRFNAQKDLDSTIENDEKRKIINNRTTVIEKGNETLTIQMGNRSETLDMGNDSLVLKMGNYSLKTNLGKIDIEAMQSITLKVGQNTIVIDQAGITINALMLKTKGLIAEHKADAMMTIKGAITMIN